MIKSDSFDVKLIVKSDFYNCPDTLIKNIYIPDPPSAGFDTDPDESCLNEFITFTSTSQGAQNYEWDFGDGSGDDMEITSHAYSIPGTYKVTLKVYDSFGCSADTSKINILVHPDPVADMSLSEDEICQFYDSIFAKDLSIGAVSNSWYLDGISYDTSVSEVILDPDTSGESILKLVVSNSFGCLDSLSNSFSVLESPIAIPSILDTTGCQPFLLPVEDLSLNSNLTTWLFDGDNSSIQTSLVHQFLDPGDFQNLLIAGNTNGCPNDTAIIDVKVYIKPIAAFDIMDFDSCGIPASIITNNLSEFSDDFNWNCGDGSNSTLFEPVKEYTIAGEYIISLITSNELGCSDTISQNIELFPQPVALFELPSLDYCESDTINIINNSINSTHFTFSINGQDVSENFPILISESGEYELSIISHFEDVCFDTFPTFHNITIHDSPTAGFISISDSDPSILGGVQFNITAIDFDEVMYNFGDGTTSNEENPFHEYDSNGPHTVCQLVYNFNEGEKTCEDKVTETTIYKDVDTFFTPNAISPDRDFGNEQVGKFKPKGVGILRYELIIYSPWGDNIKTLNQVFEGEPIDEWDGTYKGSPVPMGSYPWKAIVHFSENDARSITGIVTVIR